MVLGPLALERGMLTYPWMVARRTLLARVGALMIAASVPGCLAPTLPLPPPDKPDIEGPTPEGDVRLSGFVPAGSIVSVLNGRTSLVAGEATGDDGQYDFWMKAQVGDPMVLWYSRSTERSPSVKFVIPEPPGAGAAAGGAAGGETGGMGGTAGVAGAAGVGGTEL